MNDVISCLSCPREFMAFARRRRRRGHFASTAWESKIFPKLLRHSWIYFCAVPWTRFVHSSLQLFMFFSPPFFRNSSAGNALPWNQRRRSNRVRKNSGTCFLLVSVLCSTHSSILEIGDLAVFWVTFMPRTQLSALLVSNDFDLELSHCL